MYIAGVSPQIPRVHPLGKPHPKEVKAAEAAEGAVMEQESAVEETTESPDSQGVLRLLQEGHFKGVSDIRLRINFFNELSAIEAEKLQVVADEQIEGILQSVDSIIGGLLEDDNAPSSEPSPELLPPPPLSTDPPPATDPPQPAPSPVLKLAPQSPSDDGGIDVVQAIAFKITAATIEPAPAAPPPPPPAAPAPPPPDITQLQEDFNQTVNQLKEDFMAADSPSTDALVEGIQSAFDKLIESLEAALAPTNVENEQESNVESGEEGNGVVEQTSEPAPADETSPVIGELTAAFDVALNELIDAFSEVKTLEPVSEPNGNGVAYQKFLNIYNEMREGTEQA